MTSTGWLRFFHRHAVELTSLWGFAVHLCLLSFLCLFHGTQEVPVYFEKNTPREDLRNNLFGVKWFWKRCNKAPWDLSWTVRLSLCLSGSERCFHCRSDTKTPSVILLCLNRSLLPLSHCPFWWTAQLSQNLTKVFDVENNIPTFCATMDFRLCF